MHTRHVRDWRLAVGTPVVPVRVSAQDRRATLQEGDGTRALCFFSSRRRHTRYWRDWSSDVCSSDLGVQNASSIVTRSKTASVAISTLTSYPLLRPRHACSVAAKEMIMKQTQPRHEREKDRKSVV